VGAGSNFDERLVRVFARLNRVYIQSTLSNSYSRCAGNELRKLSYKLSLLNSHSRLLYRAV
jgi:hypothetical protein